MALRIALCGTTTQRTGTEESYWQITFNSENHGINMEAKIKETAGSDMVALMFRDGMNTYVGVMQKDGASGPWPCRGLYYHDDDGGPSSDIPRGTFNLRAYKLEVGGKTIVFDGSYSDDHVNGSHFSMAVVLDDSRAPQNHPGSWDAASSTLRVLHGNRLYVGKWTTSNSNVEKWTGVFYNPPADATNLTIADFDIQRCPAGTFLLYPTELKDD